MTRCFIDTNILLRHLLQDHDDHSPRASALMECVGTGEVTAFSSETVVFEALFTMTSTYGVPRTLSREFMGSLLRLSNLILPTKQELLDSMDLWVDETPLSFADCYHLVLTKSLGLTSIYSFDKKIGRYPGVERIEP